MTDKDKAKKLKKQLEKLPEKDRIREILNIYTLSDLPDLISLEEFNVMDDMFYSFMNPTKKSGLFRTVPDTDKLMENLMYVEEIIVDCGINAGKSMAKWKDWLEKDQGKKEYLQDIDEKVCAHNIETAKHYALDSSFSNAIIRARKMLVHNFGLERNDFFEKFEANWNELLRQKPELNEKFTRMYENGGKRHETDSTGPFFAAIGFAQNMVKERLNDKDRILADYGLQSAMEETNIPHLKKLGESRPELSQSCILDTKELKYKLLKHPDIWRSGANWMSKRRELRTYLNDNSNLLKSASKTLALFEKMERNYSGYFDSTSYKDMMTPLRQLRDKMNEFRISHDGVMETELTQEQSQQLSTLLQSAVAKSAEYVSRHAEPRGSIKGKGRFDTAMEIIAVTDMDMAYMVADSVNIIRAKSKEKDKQIVNINEQLRMNNLEPGFSQKFRVKTNTENMTVVEGKEIPEYNDIEMQELYKTVEKIPSQTAIDNMIDTHKKVLEEPERRRKEAFSNAGKAVYGDEKELRSKVGFAQLQNEEKGITFVQELNADTIRKKTALRHEQEKEENRLKNRKSDQMVNKDNNRNKEREPKIGEEFEIKKNKKKI